MSSCVADLLQKKTTATFQVGILPHTHTGTRTRARTQYFSQLSLQIGEIQTLLRPARALVLKSQRPGSKGTIEDGVGVSYESTGLFTNQYCMLEERQAFTRSMFG